MKNTLGKCHIIVVVLLLSTVAVWAAKADFNGTWVLDKAKSEGLPPNIMDQVMTITQTDNTIKVEAKVTTEQGEQVINDDYVVNGQETDFTAKALGGATGKGKRISKWSDDGNGLEVSETATFGSAVGQEIKIQATRKWTLSADGKTLVIDLKLKGPNGEQETRRTFVKK